MVLMERENSNIRTQLHAKKNKRKRTYTTGKARLMTSVEMRQALLDDLHKKQMGELHAELKKKFFPAIKKAIGDAEKAAKAVTKRAEQQKKAAAKAAERTRKAAEKETAKAAARARGRGRGRRGTRARAGGVGRGGRGLGTARDSSEEDRSESESEDEDTDLDDPVIGAGVPADSESSGEETDLQDPIPRSKPRPSMVSALLIAENEPEEDSDDDSDGEETGIVSINGHRWAQRQDLEFQVIWKDGDVTWEPRCRRPIALIQA
ncbi:hypothetical protein GGX14DRAFT_459068 [Mycena pura]|uniref:Chromo domain-containing protein n=1 Tax=Mycena pura TaxID=153505 RepID=A0AAD6YC24_9AGAR|nr:hypothetical protein GGX14DRAFT_459068 [Mycena pura]